MKSASSIAVRVGHDALRIPPPEDSSRLVSDWLDEHGVALNMRCGGRGHCRGCLIEVAGLARPVRACQTTCAELPAAVETIVIPPSSLADHSLHGVSDFEVRGKPTRPSLRPGFGLALDIGTTTVAGALWNLADGTCLATASRGNAQRRHGDDVVSRITFAVEHEDGIARLRHALVADTLGPLVEALASDAAVRSEQITEAVVAGNPTMLHTLTGESLVGLATYPFRPVFLGARVLTAADLGLRFHGRVQLLPGLGPFVGADIVAGALASGMLEDDQGCSLLVDFGTNGELLLRTPEGCFAAAAAAGPAFEGGRLRHGATARAGVVSSMRMGEGGWMLDVIGGGTDPHGISGAAYVDFLAQALQAGLLDTRGRFNADRPEVRAGEPGANTGGIVEIAPGLDVSESDVAEILQAKAAIAGGVATLMEVAGIRAPDLNTVLVAGGFGYSLDVGHALAIGLLPDVAPERVDLIGNASLGGASLILQAGQPFTLDRLVKSTRVIELNQVPSFEDHFTSNLCLGGEGHP
jgi:uncharacterized 2Fe-2S/4Fe-4S cluster protein (DUF4445 family)